MTPSEAREVLCVSEDATEDEIRKAYRLRVTIAHPDRGGSTWFFRQVSEAYKILSAPPKEVQEGEPQDSQTTSQEPSQDPAARLHPLVREVLEHVADESSTPKLERILGSRAEATQHAVKAFLSVLGGPRKTAKKKRKKT